LLQDFTDGAKVVKFAAIPATAANAATSSNECPTLIATSTGASPSGKAAGFDPAMRWFESSRPCHFLLQSQSNLTTTSVETKRTSSTTLSR
jgi:hypothetical protein